MKALKDMNRFQKIMLGALVVSLAVGLVAMFLTRTISREPTAEEILRYSPCNVNWNELPAEEGQTAVERLLALCEQGADTEVNGNTYESYTSESLGGYLNQCASVDQILVSADGVVMISYTSTDGYTVILACDAEGTAEQSIYDPETDFLFFANRETTILYEHFSSSTVY